MRARSAARWIILLSAFAQLLNLAYFAFLPAKVPMHWNIQGQVDGWMSKSLIFLPPIVGFIFGMFLVVWPKRKRTGEGLDSMLNLTGLLTCALFTYIHWCTLQTAVNSSFPAMRMLLGALFIFFGYLGFLIKNIEPNPWAGIRVKWTMKDPIVWKETHEYASKLMVGASVLAFLSLLIGAPFFIGLGLILIAPLLPIPFAYKRYMQRNTLNI
jgi:uncharacterized membrane protein